MQEMFVIEHRGIKFRIRDYDHSPYRPGGYWEPPEPEEIYVNEMDVEEGDGWHQVPDALTEMLQEDEFFIDDVLKGYSILRAEIAMDRAEYLYEERRERRAEKQFSKE